MIRRMGRPGLLGTMARTAVVAGTATAVAGRVHQRQAAGMAAHEQQLAAQQAAFQAQADTAELQAQLAALQAQQAVPAPAPAAPAAPAVAAGGSDLMDQLQNLASMRSSGLLTDDEFSAAKAKLLGG